MYTLVRLVPFQELLVEQLPALIISLIIAELFYKFHSFTLECIAFLLTWYVIDAGIKLLRDLWKGKSKPI